MKTEIIKFESQLWNYEDQVQKLLGTKYGISSNEFMIKAINAVKKNPKLLQCTPQSLFGSILYFAEVGLPFDTPEGFGYILPYSQKGQMEATPILGYKGLIEMAYRNPKMKSIRIQAVYENDQFSYEYGTTEFINHKPTMSKRGKLVAVYAIAKMENIDPLFVVVHEDELNKIQNLSKSGNSAYSPYNSGIDVFNIMQSKVAIKLLFKTLPKSGNEDLVKVLDLDNKFDYGKNVKIKANANGYEIIEEEKNTQNALEEKPMQKIEIKQSKAHKEMSANETK